jgi:hypothetical protein
MFRRLVQSAVLAWTLALMAFALSLAAEFYSAPIIQATENLLSGTGKGLHLGAAFFWAACFVWAIAMVSRVHHEAEEHRRTARHLRSEHLSNSAPQIPILLRTLVTAEREASELDLSDPKSAKGRLVELIQSVLQQLAAFSAKFAQRSDEIYGANLFITVAPMRDQLVLQDYDHLIVSEDIRAKHNACLLLPSELRYLPRKLARKPKGGPERPFLLPVAASLLDGNARIALPGAPEAFIRREVCVYNSIELLLEETSHFSKQVRDAVKEHFESRHGRGIKSFLSLPVLNLENPDTVLGVLNIDCTVEKVLGTENDEVLQDYYALCEACLPRFSLLITQYAKVLDLSSQIAQVPTSP